MYFFLARPFFDVLKVFEQVINRFETFEDHRGHYRGHQVEAATVPDPGAFHDFRDFALGRTAPSRSS